MQESALNLFRRFVAKTPAPTSSSAARFADRLFAEMLGVMSELDQLIVGDFDLTSLKNNVVVPVAEYLHRLPETQAKPGAPFLPFGRQRPEPTPFVQPIFLSGKPGIGKTTLLMILDEALIRLGTGTGTRSASLRDLVGTGQVRSYFPDKGTLSVTPLPLFGRTTAVLSVRDWTNILRHWTYDEQNARKSSAALDDFVRQLTGKLVIIDEAEIEGYIYFTEMLAQRGVQILLTSNLTIDLVHLDSGHVRVVPLEGIDHRKGDLARLCQPLDGPNWFDHCARQTPIKSPWLAGAEYGTGEAYDQSLVCLRWRDIENRPLLKDDFAHFLAMTKPDVVLLDRVPFLSEINANDIDLAFLGCLARFVNFVDAVHDCRLKLIVRGVVPGELDTQVVGPKLMATLAAYDRRTGDAYGQVAWIEWTRCLSRLKSLRPVNPV